MYVDVSFLIDVEKLIAGCKINMGAKFEMEHFRMMHYFSGLEV